MSLKERTINIDIMTKEYTKLKYKQGDSNQTLKFKFYKNGSELNLTGYVAGIFYEKPNNEVLEKTGTISTNTVTTTITSGVLNTAGVVKTEIFLTKGDEVSISFTILIEVEGSIDKNSAVQEKEEWDVIKDLLNNGNNVSLIDDSLTTTNKTWSSSKIDSQIKDIENNIQNIGQPTDEQVSNVINEAIANGEIVAGGITTTAQTLLISILRNATYINDQSTNIDALATALASNSSSGGTETTQYTITNTLSNATSSNATVLVDANASYSATITASDGYVLDAITVTMGGMDISNTAVSGSNISISSVTGNIVITAIATEVVSGGPYVYNLADIATKTIENTSANEAAYYDAGNSDAGGYGKNNGYTTYVVENIKQGDIIITENGTKSVSTTNIGRTIVYIDGTSVKEVSVSSAEKTFQGNYTWMTHTFTIAQDYPKVYVLFYPVTDVEDSVNFIPTLTTNTAR